MISTLTLNDFKNQFANNPQRSELFASLEKFAETLQKNFSSFRVVAYGSFITDKVSPSDIDLMIYVCSTPKDVGFNKFKRIQDLADSNIDVFTLKLAMEFGEPGSPPTADAMVELFNRREAHMEKNIQCVNAVELIL